MVLQKRATLLLAFSSLFLQSAVAHPHPRQYISQHFVLPNVPGGVEKNMQTPATGFGREKNGLRLSTIRSYDEANSADVAQSLSGTYYGLNSNIVKERKICPEEIQLLAKVGADENVQIPLPVGLRDTFGRCYTVGDVKESSIVLFDKTNYPSNSLSVANTKRLALSGQLLMGSVPPNLLKCPGDMKNNFYLITLTPLNRYLIPILIQNLKAVGVPSSSINDIFNTKLGSADSGTGETWASADGMECLKSVQHALEYFSHDYVLSLSRKEDDLAAAGHKAYSCVSLGGSSTRSDTDAIKSKFVLSLSQIATNLKLPLPKITSEYFYPTNPGSKYCENSPKPKVIKILAHSSAESTGPWGSSSKFNISFNGQDCATMRLYRFASVRLKMNKTGVTWKTAHRSLAFLEKHAPAFAQKEGSYPTFTSYIPGLKKSLQCIRLKSHVYVGLIEFGDCNADTPPVEVVLIKKPASFFYCHGFTRETQVVSKYCQGERIEEQASGTDNSIKEEVEATVFGSIMEFTMVITEEGSDGKCIYSSSKYEAAQLRNVLQA